MARITAWLLTLALMLAPSLAHAEAASIEEQLSAVFAEYDTLGASVAVIQNGEISYLYQYGVRSVDGEAVTADALFQVGSISKMVSNIGLMQLVEQGKADLDDDLQDLLGVPFRNPFAPSTPVTLRQLMTHTASLRDSTYYRRALGGERYSLEWLMASQRIGAAFEERTPGIKRVYSNFGGGLIGSLIEKLSGQTLNSYMAEHVFAPLDIIASYCVATLPENAPLCDLYLMPQKRLSKRLSAASVQEQGDAMLDYTFTAGKLIISAPDLAKLLIALCDGGVSGNARILKPSTVAKITTVQNHIGSVACDSENGLFLNIITDYQVEGRTMYGHGGKANGMLCAAYFDPTDRTGVVMLTNGCDNERSYFGVGMLGREVMRVIYESLIGDSYTPKDPFAVE